MDDGLPVAYQVLERDVPVYASGGELVGTVDHVVAAPQEDIFHGVVVQVDGTARLVLAEDIESLHEHGVHLRIDAAAASALHAPDHASAPAWRVHEPGVKPGRWNHFVDGMTGGGWRRNWDRME